MNVCKLPPAVEVAAVEAAAAAVVVAAAAAVCAASPPTVTVTVAAVPVLADFVQMVCTDAVDVPTHGLLCAESLWPIVSINGSRLRN